MSDSGPGPLPYRLDELIADPEAQRWARDCVWVPGSGYCRNRPCSTACLFRVQRQAEGRRFIRLRRQRRPIQRALPTS